MTAPEAPQSQLAGEPFAWRPLEKIGEGATSLVFRARHVSSGEICALKVARPGSSLAHEAEVVGRVARRWGPALRDLGRVPPGTPGLPNDAPYLATEWAEGEPLDRLRRGGSSATGQGGARERIAAVVAHGVGRALAELHEAGVRHGDVKRANVVVAVRRASGAAADSAAERGATLIDLGLSADASHDALEGGTPRYVAPEARALTSASPAADLYALGVVLAEVLDDEVAGTAEPAAVAGVARAAAAAHEGEPFRWVEALLAEAPGGRPSARWLSDRAARWLGLRADPEDAGRDRMAAVRRAYLGVRARELRAFTGVDASLRGAPRAWIEATLAWTEKLARAERVDGARATRAPTATAPITQLDAIGRARWLVALVGPTAASWSLEGAGDDAELADRLVELARVLPASSWTLDDVAGFRPPRAAPASGDAAQIEVAPAWSTPDGAARLARELARPRPDAAALAIAEDAVASGGVPEVLAVQLASALLRAGESGRAWAALSGAHHGEAEALRAEVARRRGDTTAASSAARRAIESGDEASRASGQATLARLAWDAGDYDRASSLLEGARGPAAAEVRALVAYAKGELDVATRIVDAALAEDPAGPSAARLEATRGLVEHARGASRASLLSFGRAVELSTRGAAIVEEATYLTGEAAAATAVGEIGRALSSATRAALLWERLGRAGDAARAWLSRAGALSTIGAAHGADEAAGEARFRAEQAGDPRAAAFARWASVEVRQAGDPRARAEAIAADEELARAGATPEDRARAAARLLVWAPDAIDDLRIEAVDREPSLGAAARWEWSFARASAFLAGRRGPRDHAILPGLRALVDVPAPLSSRGPALDAALRLALEQGDGEAAQRFELARQEAARALHEGTPPALRASLSQVAWARAPAGGTHSTASFAPAQVAQLESIVRALGSRDRLKPLLEQVLDTLILWTGVERGLLLLRAPDGRLAPRVARNLAKKDLSGEQLALSQGIARRAIETGDAVVATDAFSSLGDLHASVHALRLRSVLAVPLIARGETLGVVYLDDRARKGAFGERELAWVRVVASQAAMAIADARDQVLLKRAVRRAERAKKSALGLLAEREVELDKAHAVLSLAKSGAGTRFAYDAIVGRSEAIQAMLKLVDRVTASDVPVLLVGESGTGKELVARAMHANGPRGARPFVGENCASVPETLLESTLFGHVKGAFTGASSTRAGLFDVADGGTLFLDEIGEMPLSMQTKLLRVLQDGEIRPVGGERTRKVDVRILGATHRDLEAMVASGAFREDLFYRLNVITIRVPALRERAGDIPVLVSHFLAKHGGSGPPKVTRGAMEKLTSFPWPGNVRQLENEIRRAVVLADDRIDVAELSPEITRGGPHAARGSGLDLRSRVDALEAELVKEALEKTRGNQTKAAQMLGLSRFGLQKMMKRLRIEAR